MILRAVELGLGPPVCLLHGLFGRAQNLGALARRLSATRRVVSLDLRNHGASPQAPGMAYATLAQDVLETLAALGALPASLFGHSMGGKAAMMAALQAPAQITRLVVADIAPVTYAHHNARIAGAMRDLPLHPGLDRAGADAFLAGAIPDAAIRNFLLQNLAFGAAPHWRIGLDHIAAGLAGIEGWPDMPPSDRYDGPTLFLSGARSDYILPAYGPAIAARFPQATVQVIEDAGHWLHADQPDAVGHSVETFLSA